MFELGNNLRIARQQRRLDIVAAEQDTKIRSKYLSALEEEDFDVLPGAVFVRGFLRTYTQYLGLDSQLFIDEYNARFGRYEDSEEEESPVLGRIGLAHDRDHRGHRAMRRAAVVSVVAIALLAWLGLQEQDGVSKSQGSSIDSPALSSKNESSAHPVNVDTPPDAFRKAAEAAERNDLAVRNQKAKQSKLK